MKHETKVGLLFLATFALIIGFAYFLSSYNPFSDANEVRLLFNFAGGIEEGSPVRAMGIKVGKVKSIEFDANRKDANGEEVKLVVTITIAKKAWDTVREDSRFFINLAGVIGEKYIEIYDIQLDKDNKMSVDRSYTNDIPKHAPSDSPFKSIWFWLPVLVSYSLLLFVNYKYNGANNGIMLAVFFVVILLEIIILYFTLNNFNRIKRLKQYTEDQLLTIINLLDIRRIFVKDSAQKLTQQYNQLRTYEQLCNSIPQAKEYLKGLEILKRNIAVLEQTYRVSDINVATPLIAVGSLLQKAVKEKYNPEAKSQNLKFINNIQPGLSLYISQEKLSLLIDPLIQNAINSSQPDQSVTIKGIPKSNKIELEIIDQGNSITEKDLPSIFRFDPKHITTPEAGYISLSLRLARLIVSTLGGEIKVSSSQKAGTIIKLIIPKTRGQNIITTTPKISKVTTPLS